MSYHIKAYHRAEQAIDYTNVGKLTHINYGFAEINMSTFRLYIPNVSDFTTFLAGVRAIHPTIKVILSIGGWGCDGFSQVANNSTYITNFANDCAAFISTYSLDGIDIDWEFPVNGGWGAIAHLPADNVNYITLLTAIKAAIGTKELSVASGNYPLFCTDINIANLNAVVDYINVQNYEFSNGVTFHNNLYMSETLRNEEWGDRVIKRYITAGATPSKIVYGMGIYGKEWQEGDTWNSGEHLFTELQADYINKNGWVRSVDYKSMNPLLTNTTTGNVIYYEDEESVLYKCEYVKKEGLAGVMYWRYEIDNINNDLLTVMYEQLILTEELTQTIFDIIYGELTSNLSENVCIGSYNDNYDNLSSIYMYGANEQHITYDTSIVRNLKIDIRVRDTNFVNGYARALKIFNKFKKYSANQLLKFTLQTDNDTIPHSKDVRGRSIFVVNLKLKILQ